MAGAARPHGPGFAACAAAPWGLPSLLRCRSAVDVIRDVSHPPSSLWTFRSVSGVYGQLVDGPGIEPMALGQAQPERAERGRRELEAERLEVPTERREAAPADRTLATDLGRQRSPRLAVGGAFELEAARPVVARDRPESDGPDGAGPIEIHAKPVARRLRPAGRPSGSRIPVDGPVGPAWVARDADP